MRHEIALGSKTDQAVNAVWAAMIYHTPALSSSLKAYGKAQLQLMVIQHFFFFFFKKKFVLLCLLSGLYQGTCKLKIPFIRFI